MNRTAEIDKLLRQEHSSKHEFFSLIKMLTSDEIRDRMYSARQTLDENTNAGVALLFATTRLSIIGAKTPNELVSVIVNRTLGLESIFIEVCRNARSQYLDLIKSAADIAINSLAIDDSKIKNRIKQSYLSGADRNIEAALCTLSEVNGIVDETYNYSVFKGIAIDSRIEHLRRCEYQLNAERLLANSKSYFDEEDEINRKLKDCRKQITVAENRKISFYRYDREIKDKNIRNHSCLEIRERYCLLAKINAEKGNKSAEEIRFWSDRAGSASLRKRMIDSGLPGEYGGNQVGDSLNLTERDGSNFQDESLGEYEGGQWSDNEFSEMGHDGDDF